MSGEAKKDRSNKTTRVPSRSNSMSEPMTDDDLASSPPSSSTSPRPCPPTVCVTSDAASPRSHSPPPAPPSPCSSPGWPVTPSELTVTLEDRLHQEKCYETPDGLLKRSEVLKNLDVLVKQWIQVVMTFNLNILVSLHGSLLEALKLCNNHTFILLECQPVSRNALAGH